MKPILACRPVELDMTSEFDRMIAAGTFVYEGSIEGTCARCGGAVWIGPKQQQVMDHMEVLCFRDAATEAALYGNASVHSLDNPQARKR